MDERSLLGRELKFIDSCPFQYVSIKGNLDKEFQQGDNLNYSIIFNNNIMSGISNTDTMHCSWDSDSAFLTSRPALVNKKIIVYNYSNDEQYSICLCYIQ